MMITLLLFNLAAYLAGSISSAVVICRLQSLPDPRTAGSKNPGATNVLRIGGKFPAICVILGDAFKGFIPIVIARIFGMEGLELASLAVSAVLGHMFPIFFGFKGGKGIATTFGALLALSWPLAIASALSWALIVFLFRYSSLAGILTAVLTPVYACFLTESDYIPAILFLSLLILFRHHENIKRLWEGTEPKLARF